MFFLFQGVADPQNFLYRRTFQKSSRAQLKDVAFGSEQNIFFDPLLQPEQNIFFDPLLQPTVRGSRISSFQDREQAFHSTGGGNRGPRAAKPPHDRLRALSSTCSEPAEPSNGQPKRAMRVKCNHGERRTLRNQGRKMWGKNIRRFSPIHVLEPTRLELFGVRIKANSAVPAFSMFLPPDSDFDTDSDCKDTKLRTNRGGQLGQSPHPLHLVHWNLHHLRRALILRSHPRLRSEKGVSPFPSHNSPEE